MKIRTGFVSNSSSSSYIVAIALIKDRKKVDEWIKNDGIELNGYDVTIMTMQEVYERNQCPGGSVIELRDDMVVIDSFQDDAKLPAWDLLPNDEIFVVNIMNDEGDTGSFSYDEINGIDYDIDIDYFDGWQRKLWDGMEPYNGLDKIEKKFGAGRNG
jgi:hypothetical protein